MRLCSSRPWFAISRALSATASCFQTCATVRRSGSSVAGVASTTRLRKASSWSPGSALSAASRMPSVGRNITIISGLSANATQYCLRES